jgi:hypothetical protein
MAIHHPLQNVGTLPQPALPGFGEIGKCSDRDVAPHREKNGRERMSDLKRDHPCCI